MAQSNNKLNNAIKIKDDEYYTKYEDVEKIYQQLKIIDYLKLHNLLVACPFSSSESNFVIYPRNNNINVEYGLDYLNFNYLDNHIVIDNPPFSKLREIVKYYIQNNIKFILLAPIFFITYSYCLELFNQDKLSITNIHWNNMSFINKPDKTVRCSMITNIKDFYIKDFLIFSKKKIKTKCEYLTDTNGVLIQKNCWTGPEDINFNMAYTISHFFTPSFHNIDKSKYYLTQYKTFDKSLNVWRRLKWEKYDKITKYELMII